MQEAISWKHNEPRNTYECTRVVENVESIRLTSWWTSRDQKLEDGASDPKSRERWAAPLPHWTCQRSPLHLTCPPSETTLNPKLVQWVQGSLWKGTSTARNRITCVNKNKLICWNPPEMFRLVAGDWAAISFLIASHSSIFAASNCTFKSSMSCCACPK